MSSLFGGAGQGQGGVVGDGGLHSFKAGRCDYDSSTNTVTPVATKGSLFIQKSQDLPGMMRVGWRNRESGNVDEEHLTCNDASFVKCKSGGDRRVYQMRFENNRRAFFWMQESDPSADVGDAEKLDDLINGRQPSGDRSGAPAAATPAPVGGGDRAAQVAAAAAAMGIDQSDLDIINALEPSERDEMLVQLGILPPDALAQTPAPPPMEVAPPAIVPAARPAPQASAGAASMATDFSPDMLQAVMAGLQQTMEGERAGASLGDVLSSEQLAPLLDDETFVQALLPHLPDGDQTLAGLRDNIAGPQYAQALRAFGEALRSEDSAAMMGQLGVDPAHVMEGGGGVAGLLHALQKAVDAEHGAAPMEEDKA